MFSYKYDVRADFKLTSTNVCHILMVILGFLNDERVRKIKLLPQDRLSVSYIFNYVFKIISFGRFAHGFEDCCS